MIFFSILRIGDLKKIVKENPRGNWDLWCDLSWQLVTAGIHWHHIQGTVQDSALHWSQTPPWLFQDYDAKPLLISQLITLGKPKMCNLPLGPISQESVYGKKDILHLPVKITVNKQIYGVSIILLLWFLHLYATLQSQAHDLKRISVCFVLIFPITTLVDEYIVFS